MQMLTFLLFFIASHWGAMRIFHFTTYHLYFWKTLPLLVLYAALVGYLLHRFSFHQFFIWQVVMESVWLFTISRKQSRSVAAMMALTGEDADMVRLMAMSNAKTSTHFTYSAFVYVLVFSVTYLAVYNK